MTNDKPPSANVVKNTNYIYRNNCLTSGAIQIVIDCGQDPLELRNENLVPLTLFPVYEYNKLITSNDEYDDDYMYRYDGDDNDDVFWHCKFSCLNQCFDNVFTSELIVVSV